MAPSKQPHPRRSLWMTNLRHVHDFVTVNGRMPAQRERHDGIPVGKWICKQRARWGTLDDTQRKLLEALPGFTLTVRDDEWDRMCDLAARAIRDGVKLHQRLSIDGEPVGQWYRDLKRGRHVLDAHRRARLRDAGL